MSVQLEAEIESTLAAHIHAKAVVADAGRPGQRVLAGSQNFSVASLGYNRELGILISSAHIVAAMSATLAGDYARVATYSPPPASTAKADGYSHSYKTDGSGYALSLPKQLAAEPFPPRLGPHRAGPARTEVPKAVF
jgi:phosphatidylserine/phosphatidylglycerophosphate/cardiolipin synthase-like enzyme